MFGRQQGFTLTELLVSLAISAILLMGISTFLIAGKASWKAQLSLTTSQEIERYVVLQLRRAIRQAYSVDSGSDADQLVLTYSADHGSRNCLGQLQTEGYSYVDRFHVSGDQLRCNGQSLISGVEAITFSYAADLDADGHITAKESVSKAPECCPVKSVHFEFNLSGINADQASLRYSAAIRRY